MFTVLFQAAGSAALLVIFYLIFKVLCCVSCGIKFCVKDEILPCFFAFYIGVLIHILITGNMYCTVLNENGALYFNIYLGHVDYRLLNLVPFKTIIQQFGDLLGGNFSFSPVLNLMGNILLFAPMPVFIKLCNQKIGNLFAVVITFLCIVFAETVQYFTGRAADIDDVILNMLGAVIALILFDLILRKLKKNRKSNQAEDPIS